MSDAMSKSRLKVAQCPFAYHKQYIQKIKTPAGPYAEFGKFMHDVFDRHFKEKGRHKNLDTFVESVVSGTEFEDRRAEVAERMENMVLYFADKEPTGTEHKWAVDENCRAISFWGEGGIWRGIIDYYKITDPESVTILDYKNSMTPLPKKELNFGDELTGYALMLKAKYPKLENFTVGYYYMPIGIAQLARRTNEQINGLLDSTIDLLDEIKHWTTFPARECAYCTYCWWKSDCQNEKETNL